MLLIRHGMIYTQASVRTVRLFTNANPTVATPDGISAISGSEMVQMPNATEAIPGLQDRYIIQLDVFHQLHCLVHPAFLSNMSVCSLALYVLSQNTVRKFIWPERYPVVVSQRFQVVKGKEFDHIDHCVVSKPQCFCSFPSAQLTFLSHILELYPSVAHVQCRPLTRYLAVRRAR